jgi:hypothetical protein
MADDLGWLTKIKDELVVRRVDYPSRSGAFSAVDNSLNRLQDELREHAAEDDPAARKEREAQS